MKHLLKLNEYIQSAMVKPKMDKVLSTPMSVEMFLKRIANRFNDLISKQSLESLEENPGLDDDFLRNLKGEFEPENMEGAIQDSQDILTLLASIRQAESEMSEQDKKDKAMEIIKDIFKGKGFDIAKLEFKLDILNDQDLMDAKSDIIGIPPEEFKDIKREVTRDKPKLKKEIDIRAIQNALTQGFASSIKDDFVMGDTEIEGVSFGDYYSLMDKTFKLYSKVPKELMHRAMTESPALGRVELRWDNDKKKYIIEAKGYTILILVHEMIKGIMELISLHRNPELDIEDEEKMMSLSGTQYMEREGLQYGPGMVNSFKEFFNQVEDNLIEQREIREKNPAMILNVLSRFYQMEDDLFLRACKAIFSDTPNKPYELFEEFYLDGISGSGFGRRDEPGNDDDPSGLDDDILRDLLGGAGINLNLDPYNESNKYTLNFELFNLLEDKKDIAQQWIAQGNEPEDVVRAIDIFSRFTSGWKKNKPLQKVISDIRGLPEDWTMADKVNIEKYANQFNTFVEVVNRIESAFKLPRVSSIKPGEINMALIPIKDALGVIDIPGFYSKATEDAIKNLQREFSEETIVPDNIDYRTVLNKIKKDGTKVLNTDEKIFLAKSAKFITSIERLIAMKTRDVNNKIKDLADLKDEIGNANDNEREQLRAEYDKLNEDIYKIEETIDQVSKELEIVRSIFSGGIEKQSGILDQPTLTALQHKFSDKDLDLSSIYSAGTLSPDKGRVVYETDSTRIWRITDHQFCINATQGFLNLMRESGVTKEMKDTYGWCISWREPGQYKQHRTNREDIKQTIYFIENKNRANYEADGIKKFLDEGGRIARRKEYVEWRNEETGSNLTQGQVGEKAMAASHAISFWDAYHIAVVFVNTKTNPNKPDEKYSYWCVDSNNSTEWGNNEQSDNYALTFEQIASAIWPTEPGGLPVPQNASNANAIRVPKDVIEQDWYKIPDQSEIQEMKDVIVPKPLSKSEAEQKGSNNNSDLRSNIRDTQFKNLSYKKKEEWINANAYGQRRDYLLRDRSRVDQLVRLDIWKSMPDALKSAYIADTKAPFLPEEYMNEIKDNPRLMKIYKGLLQSRLLTSDPQENLLANIENVINKPDALKQIIANRLTPDELKLVTDGKTEEMKNLLDKKTEELENIERKEYSAKNARRKKSLNREISKLKRILYDESLSSKYSGAMKKVLSPEYQAVIALNVQEQSLGKLLLDEIIRSGRQASLADLAISGKDTVDFNGKKIFRDSMANLEGIDSLNIDHSKVPHLNDIVLGNGEKFTDFYSNILKKIQTEEDPRKLKTWEVYKKYFDHMAERYMSSILLGGEDVGQILKNNGTIDRSFDKDKHSNQIKEVFSYILKMDPKFLNWIDFMTRSAWYHYGLNSINNSDSPISERNFKASIAKSINNLIDRFPSLERRGSKVKKIRIIDQNIGQSSKGGPNRTTNTEILG